MADCWTVVVPFQALENQRPPLLEFVPLNRDRAWTWGRAGERGLGNLDLDKRASIYAERRSTDEGFLYARLGGECSYAIRDAQGTDRVCRPRKTMACPTVRAYWSLWPFALELQLMLTLLSAVASAALSMIVPFALDVPHVVGIVDETVGEPIHLYATCHVSQSVWPAGTVIGDLHVVPIEPQAMPPVFTS